MPTNTTDDEQVTEILSLLEILEAHAEKPFVKRIMEPEKHPTLDLGNGQYATHKMATAEVDTPNGVKHVVFPTVRPDTEGKLVDYGNEAWSHASKDDDFIEFDDAQKADWFSKNYKKVWSRDK